LLNDENKLESPKENEMSTGQEIPQTAWCKAKARLAASNSKHVIN